VHLQPMAAKQHHGFVVGRCCPSRFHCTVAAARLGVVTSLPFVLAAAGLILLAIGTFQEARLPLAVSVALLGAQLIGVAGSAWELLLAEETAKTQQLRSLGFDPTFGIVLNLVYSAVASLLFVWVLVRWRRCRSVLGSPSNAQNPGSQERR
jgi:hypothetical protein